MVKINRIYTRTGDTGETGLVGGARVSKDAPRVDTNGDVDELNAFLGVATTHALRAGRQTLLSKLQLIQNEIFDIGAVLATPAAESWEGMIDITPQHLTRFERWIDELTDGLPELRSFVLPGGTELNAALHVARTVCRRVERRLVALSRLEPLRANTIPYFNRLSDLLFAMARAESAASHTPEVLWVPGQNRPGT